MNAVNFCLALLFAITTKTICAQVPATYQGDYNRLMSNMTNPASRFNINGTFALINLNKLVNLKHNFKVVMKDGTVLTVNSKIYPDPVNSDNYLVYTDNSKKTNDPNRKKYIFASETKEISRLNSLLNTFSAKGNQFTPRQDTSRVTGVATDSCWLFKMVSGKISAYSFLSERPITDVSSPIAIQFGNNVIEKLNLKVLEAYIKDDEKAYKAFLKKDYYKAIELYNKNHQ